MNTIFVSSTFRDMNGERDIIQQKVVPSVNMVAEQYGESIWCKDLRWGIDTTDLSEARANAKVLDVCLDEIERSNPPFVILLGERYGWIPGHKMIKSKADRKRMQLENLEISVTALEIEYGAFCRQYSPIVYYREAVGNVPTGYLAEDAEHKEKLDALKERLRHLCGERIRTYRVRFDSSGPNSDDLDAFANRLSADICAILQPRWERFSHLSPRQKELAQQQHYLEERAQQYVHVSDDEQTIYDALVKAATTRRTTVSPYAGLFLYQNNEGTGKSMLFARTVQHLSEDPLNVVLPFAVGLTPKSTNATEILKSEVFALEAYVNSSHLEDEDAGEQDFRERLGVLCDYLADNGRRLFFLVDGIDKMQPGQDLDKLVFLPKTGREGIAMLLMARHSYSTPLAQRIEPTTVTFRERQSALNGLLAYYGRELSEQVKLAVIEKTKDGGLLHVAVLLKRLLQMNAADFAEINRRGGGIDAINAYQMELVVQSPASVDELSYQVIENIAQAVNPELVHHICSLLCVSSFGLRDSDLAAIIGEKFNSLDLASMIHSWSECFLITEDGRVSFQMDTVASGCFGHVDDPTEVARSIFQHLCGLDERDEFRRKNLLYYAQLGGSLEDPATLRYINKCTGDDFEWAAYSLWQGCTAVGVVQIIELILTLGTTAEVDARLLPTFLGLWTLLMAAFNYYRTDPDYERIVSAYYSIALSLKEAYGNRFAHSFDRRIDDCYRILSEYHLMRGDLTQAEKYKNLRTLALENPFTSAEPDKNDAKLYLMTIVNQINSACTQFSKGKDKSVLAKAAPTKDELLELCRNTWVKVHLPSVALLGLATVEMFEMMADDSHMNGSTVANEVFELLAQHPELDEDEIALPALAYLYSAESQRLSHALKGERIPKDKREQALRYSIAAQKGYGKMIQENPSRENCILLAIQKLNTSRLLEQRGTTDALRAALNELIDASNTIGRIEYPKGEQVIDPMLGFTLHNRMGQIASGLGDQQLWDLIESAYDNALAYAQGLPSTGLNLILICEVLQDQSTILEKMGKRKQLEMAELRLSICERIMERLSSKDALKRLSFTERLKVRKWRGEVEKAHKRIKKKLRW